MITILYQLFGILSGVIEAVLYSRRGAEAFSRNEHIEMMLQRISVALLPLAGAWLYRETGSMLYVGFELLPAALLFPLCHDEAYNFTRLWVAWKQPGAAPPAIQTDMWAFRAAWRFYQYGYQSPTTTARNDFNGKQRTWLAAAAAMIWAIGYLIIL